MTTKISLLIAAALTLGGPTAALAQHGGHHHGAPAPSAGDDTAAAAQPAQGARVIALNVTKDGFVPAEIKVKQGERIRLAVTRQVEKTCATEIVVKDYGINAPLPLGKTVYVELTPKKTGTIRYACGMDMVSGVLVVE